MRFGACHGPTGGDACMHACMQPVRRSACKKCRPCAAAACAINTQISAHAAGGRQPRARPGTQACATCCPQTDDNSELHQLGGVTSTIGILIFLLLSFRNNAAFQRCGQGIGEWYEVPFPMHRQPGGRAVAGKPQSPLTAAVLPPACCRWQTGSDRFHAFCDKSKNLALLIAGACAWPATPLFCAKFGRFRQRLLGAASAAAVRGQRLYMLAAPAVQATCPCTWAKTRTRATAAQFLTSNG